MELVTKKGDALTAEEISQIMEVIQRGQAVSVTAQRLSQCKVVCYAKEETGQVLGVGAIKGFHRKYTESISERAGYSIDELTREIGYFAVDSGASQRAISRAIAVKLLTDYHSALYFTTGNEKIKTLLVRAGFKKVGSDWQGNRSMLSLMVRPDVTRRERMRRFVQKYIVKPLKGLPV